MRHQEQATASRPQTASPALIRSGLALLHRLGVQHIPLLWVVLLYLALSITYASLIPLGEAPDEPAHLSYAQFIAKEGRLPADLAERQAAGYRSVWPPLYPFLVAGPVAVVGDTPPTRLKSVGDTPRRLIPTNGQTIAAFIHTTDETWPWRGISLAWHLGRFISVLLTALAVITTYAIAWRLTARRTIAWGAAALHATIPQVLFTGSVLNDDNLLILFSGLILFTLIVYTQQAATPSLRQSLFLGALLGLASVTKYNALPLWPLVLVWGGWLSLRPSAPNGRIFAFLSTFNPRVHQAAKSAFFLGSLIFGAALTGGWWFLFVWLNFNQVDRLGVISGSLAALSAGTADASLRQLASGNVITLPPPGAWLEWLVRLFQSFWGRFGGSGTIDLPVWIYWLLAMICALAAGSIVWELVGHRKQTTGGKAGMQPALVFFLLTPLFFLPLPLLRFILTNGSLTETAQGRHLFPALPAITFAIIWGLSRLRDHLTKSKKSKGLTSSPSSRLPVPLLHFILHPSSLRLRSGQAFILLTAFLSLYSLTLIRTAYPPPIPLSTTAEAAAVENQLRVGLTEAITLVGYGLGPATHDLLPLTLVWQADAVPAQDYLIELMLTGATGQPLGGWIGHPLGGRYPTRAWDEGDILRDEISIPLLPTAGPTTATLRLNLYDSATQVQAATLMLARNLALGSGTQAVTSDLRLPSDLRADGLRPEAPFTYRSTLSFMLPDTTKPELIASTDQTFAPVLFLTGDSSGIAHFIVAANWPAGSYHLSSPGPYPPVHISNRPRRFEPPAMDQTVEANFANHLTLLGYDLPQQRVQPGDSFPITLYWRAEQTLGRNLTVFNHLLDQNAVQYGGTDRIPLNYYTTLLWVPGEIVADSYEVPVERMAPPGVYWLDVGLYPSDEPNFSLPLFVEGQPIDRNSVSIGPVKVGGPPPGVTITQANPQHQLNQSFGQQLTLLGFDLGDTGENLGEQPATGSQERKLILFWRAETAPAADYTVFVHLLNRQGDLVAQFDSPPAGGAYPTSLWDPGEIIVDERLLTNLPPGQFTLQVGLYHPATGERLPVAGEPNGAVQLAKFEVEVSP